MAATAKDTTVYDYDKTQELSDTLGDDVRKLLDEYDEMFDVIDNQMNDVNVWSGPSYEAFREKCDNFRKNEMADMESKLRAFSTHLSKASTDMEETTITNTRMVELQTDIDGVKRDA